eukprot:TRINITY_DN3939_c0_g1_i1.p1 TRINITY_DN3939_c0_g1~~TRINITY_DN3939_c0_g1_i1.p1  ORF type:complete len:1028 (+),score=267.90 TRINITY_DN3939_c0_g1_i1:154-3237(+)
MGVPKFFRWLSERYPLVNQVVGSNSFPPEFDNFYLDMNGIIHNCSRLDGEDEAIIQLTENQMILRIVQYIDKLFHLIMPKKLIYLAIDGVAPRAKMNQQRSRRFRKAKDSKEALKKAQEKGTPISEGPIFDSNCITPGTPFMGNLATSLRFYIRKKMMEDASWRKIQVIFSGPETPGEGEHKIMEYIRHQKSQPDWDPNIRHCLYGLDADLIMLSLTTHEPHFALLREDVLTKQKGKMEGEKNFQLLHIGLVREYLDLDFQGLKLPFAYDLERVIDDFVLMCFFIGNDFLPTLPGLDIGEGSLNNMMEMYKDLLPRLGGYLTEGANISLERVEQLLKRMSATEREQWELMTFSQGFDRIDGKKVSSGRSPMTLSSSTELTNPNHSRFEMDMKSIGVSMSDDEEDDELWKDYYYKDKFKFPLSDTKFHKKLQHDYIRGIYWVLNYYHNGCISWPWYFEYHYAPLISDLRNLKEVSLEFEFGQPFKPYQQLLAVLPPESKDCLPVPYQRLMLDPASPIADFYPASFELDSNGKKNEWEYVALLPFIDQDRLVKASDSIPNSALATIEIKRNQHGPSMLYAYSTSFNERVQSPFPELFADIKNCNITESVFELSPFPSGKHEGFKLLPRCKKGVQSPPGWPSLHHKKFRVITKQAHVNIFGGGSRRESLVLDLNMGRPMEDLMDETNPEARQILMEKNLSQQNDWLQAQFNTARKMVGKRCYVDWPYFRQAELVGIATREANYFGDGSVVEHPMEQKGLFVRDANYMENQQMSTRAVDISPLQIMAVVKVLSGISENLDGSRIKLWSSEEEFIPFPLIVDNLAVEDTRMRETGATKLSERLSVGQEIIYLGKENSYGSRGVIVASQAPNAIDVEIQLEPPVPTFGRDIASSSKERYWPLHDVARNLNIPIGVLAKITGLVFFQPGKINLGLGLKFSSKNLQILGYSRLGRSWEFSQRAIDLIAEYRNKFPKIFEAIDRNPGSYDYDADSLFEEATYPGMPKAQAKKDAVSVAESSPVKNTANRRQRQTDR